MKGSNATMVRRDFLATSAAAGTLLMIGPTGACASATVVGPWGGPAPRLDDPRLRALSYGLLAPNSHNTQPWKVKLIGDNQLDLYVDESRLLRQTDPELRQIYVSHGTFLETMRVGASGEQLLVNSGLFPHGDTLHDPVARVEVHHEAGLAPDPLAAQVLARHTNKRTYDDRPLNDDAKAFFARFGASIEGRTSSIQTFTNAGRCRRIAEACVRAMEVEVASRERNGELARWFRFNDDEIRRHRDGFGVAQAGRTGFSKWIAETFFIGRNDGLLDPDGSFAKSGVDMTRGQVDSAAGFVALSSARNDRSAQVRVGMVYSQLELGATAHDVRVHPLSQALQEYADMKQIRAEMNELVGLPAGHTLQMLARVGYASPTRNAPRRDPEELLVDG